METEGKRLTPPQGWVLAITSVASFMVSLDTQVVATALPVIRVHLHASLAALEWTVNAYTLTFAVLLLPGAALGERLGRRRMLAIGMGLFTAASAGCALAPNAGALIAARAVQGAGGALVLPLAFALLSAGFPPQRRPWAIGIFTAVTGLAVAAGPVVGGAVAQGIAWPWIFWLNVPIGLVLIPLVATRLTATTRATARPRSARPGAGDRRRARHCLGADPRDQPRLGQPADRRDAGGRGGADRRAFIGWELRAAHPDGAAAAVPHRVRSRQATRPPSRIRHASRPGVLHGAVSAERPRLRTVRHRPSATAWLGHPGGYRAVRRRADPPVRRAAADHGRTDAVRRGADLDSADRQARAALRGDGRAADPGRRRGLGGDTRRRRAR